MGPAPLAGGPDHGPELQLQLLTQLAAGLQWRGGATLEVLLPEAPKYVK